MPSDPTPPCATAPRTTPIPLPPGSSRSWRTARSRARSRARCPAQGRRPDPMRLLALLVIGGFGGALSAWGLHRGGRAARVGALIGVLALLGVTVVAFALRPGRIDDLG